MLTSKPKLRLVGYYVPQVMLVFVCLFVGFEFFDKRFFIFYIFIFYLFKRKEILSNFFFSVFLFLLFLMMAHDFFS